MSGERRRLIIGERATLDPFIALPDDGVSPRDQRDLMERPFFSLAKSKRTKPILYKAGDTQVQVHAVPEFGMATIWDADVLIWAATQIVEAADKGLGTSRFVRFTPYQLLMATGRGTGFRQYKLLKGALQRLQSTVEKTTIRHGENWRRQQFSWLNEWEELTDSRGRGQGMEFVLPEWFYQGVLDRRLVLTIDPTYFRLTGGIERWLYRVARKHGGRQPNGWAFEVRHLHAKSGSLARVSDFALDLRRIAARQSLPGYRLSFEWEDGRDLLRFTPGNPARLSTAPVDNPVEGSGTSGARRIGTSGARGSVHQAHGSRPSHEPIAGFSDRNFSNSRESNFCFRDGEKASRCRCLSLAPEAANGGQNE
jgi:plasmid replication initiation protein